MSSQIFKTDISKNVLFDFLENNSIKTNKYYLINSLTFKKSQLNNSVTTFFNGIEKYYHKSKRYYINREITYARFITVIRQICKFTNVSFNSKINYSNSNYNIYYYIYF